MSSRLFALLAFLAFLPANTVFAHDFSARNEDGKTIYYNRISETKCEVTYYGAYISTAQYTGDINIPATVSYSGRTYAVTSIGDDAFYYCQSLTSVTLPNSVTAIGKEPFIGCTSLSSINIPNSVTSIGESAFYNCTSLSSINIPNSVTSIGRDAFSNCNSLTSINIPNSVTSIGLFAFNNLASLTSITVDPTNPNYSSLDGVLFDKDQSSLICCPSGKQGEYTIPNSVTAIAHYAFGSCISLTTINLPNSLFSIGNSAFYECTSLTAITLPNSIKLISSSAFNLCTSLSSVTILIETPPALGNYVFNLVPLTNATLYVPAGTKDRYAAAAQWSDFNTIIELGPPCAAPTLTFTDGIPTLTCETAGATIHYSLATEGSVQSGKTFINGTIDLTLYATAPDYAASEPVTINLFDLLRSAGATGDINADGELTVADVTMLVQMIMQAKPHC